MGIRMTSNQYYNNNRALKKQDSSIPYTKEQIAEITKCMHDIVYFMGNYITIISLDKGRVKFKPYAFQETLLKDCQENRFNIFTIERQAGKTITVAAFLLREAIFRRDITIGILANNASKSQEILSRIKLMYEELPWWLKPGVLEWNKRKIQFSNGSIIFTGPTTESSLRGYSINILYLDEFAFVDNDVEFYTSAYPVISSGKTSKIIITSTPKGMNLFYKIWTDSINGKNDYHHRLFTWKNNPTKDEAWKKQTLRNMDKRQFRQEHECEFFGSSNTLISGEALATLTYSDPINKYDDDTDDEEYLRVYELPEEGAVYISCVDVSEGVGKDNSTIQIIKISEKPYKQVCVYKRNDISPWVFPDVVEEIGLKYNTAYTMIENNSVGKIVADLMNESKDYENLLSSSVTKGTEVVNEYSLVNTGIKMTTRTKATGCSALKTLIEENFLQLHDWDTIQEFTTFVKSGNTYKAEKKKHDDLVMPFVAFAWLTTQPLFEDLASEQMQDLLKQKREEYEDETTTLFGYFSDGTEGL
jgi:hypothetical protein